MTKKITLVLCLCLFAQAIFSQTAPVKKDNEISAETKKQAVALLRETFGEVNNLRTLENRIGFSSELASMLWYEDEKEARAMFGAIIGDFNQLLAQYDSQLSSFGEDAEDAPYYGGFFGGGDLSEKGKVRRKFSQAMRVRQQIASSLAEHDAKFAFDFYDNSLQLITNAKLRQQYERQDSYFQTRLLQKIAENDPANALEFGRRSVTKGLNYGQIDLLKKIYAKDVGKGAEFAQILTDKIKSEKTGGENYYVLVSLFRAGADNFEKSKKDGKKPMFSEQNLRDLAEISAQTILQSNGRIDTENLDLIEKYAPARAAQINAVVKSQQEQTGVLRSSGNISNRMMSPPAPPAPNGNYIANSASKIDSQKENAEQLEKNLKSLDGNALPKEEREKVVAQARKIAAEMPDKQARILALGALAAQISKAGDKELADRIMNDAQSLVNLQPKNYQDYMNVLLLVSGYAQTSPEKAFPILDDSIYRINETIAAAIKMGEFIDVPGEMIENGEVQIGTIGELGEFTRGLALANGTIRKLAVTDFEKTRALTNRFDRPEARILAKMLVLRAVLGDNKIAGDEKKEEEIY